MKIEIVRNLDATRLMADDAFRAAWAQLWDLCPWATTCQAHGFAAAWYSAYDERYEPVLVMGRDDAGKMVAVLPLAKAKRGGRVVVAGSNQAEYQACISSPEHGDTFMRAAMLSLQPLLTSAGITMRYVPALAPGAWLDDVSLQPRIITKWHRRPLMRFDDGKGVEASLKKAGNKNRLRQIRKLGNVALVQITDPAELERCLDWIIEAYDLRRLAISGIAPFRKDPCKRLFHLNLMRTPGLLHVTVLKVGDQIASAHLNAMGKRDCIPCLICHSASMGAHSPGKIHMLMLAQMLLKQGYEQLDLTPGGDAYKERFATAWDEVREVSVFPTVAARRRMELVLRGETVVRAGLTKAKVPPSKLLAAVHEVQSMGPMMTAQVVSRCASNWIASRDVIEVYRWVPASAVTLMECPAVRQDALQQLLDCDLSELGISRRQFVSEALRRIEFGNQLYSVFDGRRLLQCGWLAHRPDHEGLAQVMPGLTVPDNSVVLFDLFSTASAGRNGPAAFVGHLLRHAQRIVDNGPVMIVTPGHGRLAEAVRCLPGMQHERSIHQTCRLGRRLRAMAQHSANCVSTILEPRVAVAKLGDADEQPTPATPSPVTAKVRQQPGTRRATAPWVVQEHVL